MAVTTKRLGRGQLSTSNAILYTVPSDAITLVKALTLCNKTAASATVTIAFDTATMIYQHVIKANDTITIPFLDQVLHGGERIIGSSGSGSSIDYYISGKEVT